MPLFRTQLRAVLRASVLGDLRLMFPLITTLLELRQAKMVLADVMEDLDDEGVAFNRKLPVGMMVEVPAAVLMIDHFVDEVDFLSIGTNDLTQYTLAADRSNKDVAELYSSADPAVLRLIDMAMQAAEPQGRAGQRVRPDERQFDCIPCCCWAWACDASASRPAAIPEIKKVCRTVTIPQCQPGDRARYDHGKLTRHQELFATGTEENPARIGRVGTQPSSVGATKDRAAQRHPLTGQATGVTPPPFLPETNTPKLAGPRGPPPNPESTPE